MNEKGREEKKETRMKKNKLWKCLKNIVTVHFDLKEGKWQVYPLLNNHVQCACKKGSDSTTIVVIEIELVEHKNVENNSKIKSKDWIRKM